MCPLCQNEKFSLKYEKPSGQRYFDCQTCGLIFLDPKFRLGPDAEKACYQNHNNDIHDLGYQQFVTPIIDFVSTILPLHARGLDFGAGPGPVVTSMLRKRGYDMKMYDPFFCHDQSVLVSTYDFIIASEVAEHFYSPAREFSKLKSLLNEQGKLVIGTSIYEDSTDFSKWYYHLDVTHVVFYRLKTVEWIKHNLGFCDLVWPHERVFVLTL